MKSRFIVIQEKKINLPKKMWKKIKIDNILELCFGKFYLINPPKAIYNQR